MLFVVLFGSLSIARDFCRSRQRLLPTGSWHVSGHALWSVLSGPGTGSLRRTETGRDRR